MIERCKKCNQVIRKVYCINCKYVLISSYKTAECSKFPISNYLKYNHTYRCCLSINGDNNCVHFESERNIFKRLFGFLSRNNKDGGLVEWEY